MIHLKKPLFATKLSLPFAFILALSLASGCSKKEPAIDHSEMKMPDTQEAPQAVAATSVTAGAITPSTSQKPTDLAPIPPDLVQLVTSNRTMTAYDQVYYITNAPYSDTEKAQALMSILPSFDRDGQRVVAHATINYVQDSKHSLILTPLIEGKLDKQILSVFMTDTLKRPDEIKIPALKTLAASAGHPMQQEATDLLEAFSKPITVSNHTAAEPMAKTD